MDTHLYMLFPLLFTIYIITKHFLHKLRNLPPTPIINLPILGHLYLIKRFVPIHRILARISQKYGPVLLLQFGYRRVLVISSPSAAEECLNKNDVIFANRPKLLSGKHMGYNYSTLVWSSYGDHWRNLRKISVIEILSAHRLQMLHAIRVDEVKFMIRRLSNASQEEKPIDMKMVFFELMMNIMMRMIAGKRYYGENVGEVEEVKRFRELAKSTMQLTGSNLADFLPAVRWLDIGGKEKKMAALQKTRDAFMQEIVEEFKRRIDTGNSENTKTMMEVLLEFQKKEPEYYTDQVIKSLMLTLLVSGTDTSSTTMEWAFSLLLNNPKVLKKAQLEIDNQIGSGRLVEEADLENLPYLRCILNETLRMYPPGPLIPHQSSEQCIVGGYQIPADTMLILNLWAIHNDPKNWEDPRTFKPERFEGLEGTRDGFRLMPFSSGRRGCPAEGLAIRVMGLGLGSVIQCFDWEREGDSLVDMKEGGGLTMHRVKPLMAYCKARRAGKFADVQ